MTIINSCLYSVDLSYTFSLIFVSCSNTTLIYGMKAKENQKINVYVPVLLFVSNLFSLKYPRAWYLKRKTRTKINVIKRNWSGYFLQTYKDTLHLKRIHYLLPLIIRTLIEYFFIASDEPYFRLQLQFQIAVIVALWFT